MSAEIAPIIFVDMIHHHAIGQPGIAQCARAVEGAAAAVLAVAVGRPGVGQGVVLRQFRFLADQIDHAARVLNTVQQRCRAFEHFDAIDRGVHATPLHDRHAVAHDRAVAVITEAAGHHRILGAAQRVALGDAADVGQRVVEIARRLIANDLRRDDIDGLRDFLKRGRGTHHRTGWRRLVTRRLIAHRGDGGGAQIQRAFGGLRLKCQGVTVGAAKAQAGTGKQALQRLFCIHLSIDGWRGEAVRRFIGVDHALPGDAAEVAQGLRQRFGNQCEIELLLRLAADGFSAERDAHRQQRQCRKT